MCLLITAAAALAASIPWYFRSGGKKWGTLALMYWGAALMWTVDDIFSVLEGGGFFDLSAGDALLGLVVVLCGLAAWLVLLLWNRFSGLVSGLRG